MEKVENKVYYGEYTLYHWIEMMLNGDIELPEYQRRYVWSEYDVERFIKSLRDGQFVPPITIAQYSDGEDTKNLILDGQQRLTSLLLAYIGYFPMPKKNGDGKKSGDGKESGDGGKYVSEDDSNEDDNKNESGENLTGGIEWQYTWLLCYGKTKAEIVSKIPKGKCDGYKRINIKDGIDDEFLKSNYLGFSYIVPDKTEKGRNVFPKLFRNINYFGKRLDPIESRRSLYFQDMKFTNYFEGECEDGNDVLAIRVKEGFQPIRVMEDFQPEKIDFVRYLAMLSQYSASKKVGDVMKGYSAYSSRESYYADYVSYILGLDEESHSGKFEGFNFSEKLKDCWNERFKQVRETVEKVKPLMPLNDKGAFETLYKADVWLLGLLYYILFEGKILVEDFTPIKGEIEKFIKEEESDSSFLKNANKIKYVRKRLEGSCKIYSNYVR